MVNCVLLLEKLANLANLTNFEKLPSPKTIRSPCSQLFEHKLYGECDVPSRC